MPKINTETTFRIVTVGDPQVGKSNLVTRFSTNTFTNQYLSTIGVEFEKVSKQIENSTINTLIWDTSGQERFRSISSKYYQSAVGVIFVYDITSIESFQNIKNWLEHVAYYSQEDPLFMLIGNKLDLAKESRAVSTKEAVEYAENNNMFHFETSALDSIGVEDAFMSLISHIYNDGPKANNKKKPKDLGKNYFVLSL
ncbi:ras-related protein Rab11D-like protein [Backusella circina FSU 941]|nr:ras-related protein Rab11D-like protein [Backusella circina FSU 941]